MQKDFLVLSKIPSIFLILWHSVEAVPRGYLP